MESLEPRELMAISHPPEELWQAAALPVGVASGSFNADTLPDLVTVGADGSVLVALNHEGTSFDLLAPQDLGLTDPKTIASGNFDLDPFGDLAIIDGDRLVIALGSASGEFTVAQTITLNDPLGLSSTSPERLAVGLWDADYNQDLLLVLPGTNDLLRLSGNGDGTFAETGCWSTGVSGATSLVAGDWIGDGRLDVAVGHAGGELVFFEGFEGSGLARRDDLLETGLGSITALATADVDEDGDADLVIAATNQAHIVWNDSERRLSPVVVNGDFTQALTGWTATAGSVNGLGGVLELREGEGLLTTAEQTLVIPVGATTLSFDILDWSLEAPTGGLPDAFEVSLLDASGQSVVPTFSAGATSFFNIAADGTIAYGSAVTWNGTKVTLDVSGLAVGTAVTLYFDLVGLPEGTGSSVLIGNVRIDPLVLVDEEFRREVLSGSFTAATDVVIADVDGDGATEIVIADASQLVIFERSDLSRTQEALFGGASGSIQLAVGRFTLDTSDDLAVAIASPNGVLTPLAVDQLAPTVELVSPAGGTSTSPVNEIVVQFNEAMVVDEGVEGSIVDPSAYELRAAGADGLFDTSDDVIATITSVAFDVESGVTTLSLAEEIGDGLYRLSISVTGVTALVTDLAGNVLGDGSGTTFTIDVDEPELPPETGLGCGPMEYPVITGILRDDGTSDSDGITSDRTLVLVGTAVAGSLVTLSLAGAGDIGTTQADKNGNWRFDYTGTFLTEGDYEFMATSAGLGPLGVATGFNLFVFDDLTHQYSDVGGRIAVGGNANVTGYGVGTVIGNSSGTRDDFIVEGDLSFSNGQVYNGNVVGGGTANLTQNANILNGTLRQESVIDFAEVEAYLQDKSADYAGRTANGVVVNQWGGLTLVGTDADLNIFDLPVAWLNSTWGITFNVPTGSSVLVNVAGTTAQMQYFGFTLGNADANRIVWNFHEATQLTIQGISVQGTILAPYAAVQFNNGNIDGTLVAKSFTGQGEMHHVPLEVNCPPLTSAAFTVTIAGAAAPLPKFLVADGSADAVFHYTVSGSTQGGFTLPAAITARGIATNASGNTAWVLDSTSTIWVYDLDGSLRGSWSATGLTNPTDIAVSGNDLWIIDATADRAYRYANGTTFRSGGRIAASSFALDSANTNPTGLAARDGNLWVTDDGASEDRVFVYTTTSSYVGNWTLDAANAAPTGITVDPAGSQTLWVVDHDDLAVYIYTSATSWTSGSHSATSSFDLGPEAVDPQGIADPATVINIGDIVSGTIGIAFEIDDYSFTASAGQRLHFTPLLGEDYEFAWTLRDEFGTILFEGDQFNDRTTVRLTTSGVYTLSVFGIGDHTGDYEFQIVDLPVPTPTPIALDATISDSLVTPFELDRFSFSAADGDRLYFELLSGEDSEGFSRNWRLVSPSGQSIFASAFVTTGLVTLNETGTYILEVEDLFDGSASYSFKIWDVPAAVPQLINIGDTASGELTTPGEQNVFEFTATAGQRVYLAPQPGLESDLLWQLTSPTGETLFWEGFSAGYGHTLSETGTYRVTVEAEYPNTWTGTFEFDLLGIAAPASMSIALDDPIAGDISTAGELDRYTFTVAAGQRVYLSLTAGVESDFVWSLYDPTGVAMESRSTFPTIDSWQLIEAGTYTFDIEAQYGATGTYGFTLAGLTDAAPEPIAFATPVMGTISAPGEHDRFTFSGFAGGVYSFDAQAGGAFDFQWRLLDPSGATVFSAFFFDQASVTLPENGTYTLEVYGYAGATGAYQFEVIAPTISPPVPIDLGEVVNGNLTAIGELDRYEIEITGDERVFFDVQSAGGSFSWELVDPNSVSVFDTSFSDVNVLELATPGIYVLSIRGNGSATGAYQFQLWEVHDSPTVAIAFGTPIVGQFDSPGERDTYTFAADAGDRIFLNLSAPFRSYTVLDSLGNAISARSSSDRDVLITTTGTYTIVVDDNFDLDQYGSYEFAAYRYAPAAPTPIATDVVIDGEIATPGEVDEYSFTAAAGDTFYLEVIGSFVLDFAYLDESGAVVETGSRFTAVSAGTYVVRARMANANLDDTMAYQFRLWAVPTDTTEALTFGVPATGELVAPTEAQSYTFIGTAGHEVMFDLQALTGAATFTLLDPAGVSLFTGVAIDQFIASLPSTGTYTLIARASSFASQVPSSFTIQVLDLYAPDLGTLDSQGTDFWVGFPGMFSIGLFGASNPFDIRLFITSTETTNGTVTIPGLGFGIAYHVDAGEVIEIDLPAEFDILSGTSGADLGPFSDAIINKGVHITADHEVTVYGTSRMPALSDAFLALPIDALGTEYVVTTYSNTQPNFSFNQFAIVATEDDTEVTITPTITVDGHTAGVPFTVTLDRGQAYQVVDPNAPPSDLSGTYITATKAIAVFGSHQAANIPEVSYSAADYLVEQLTPVSTWGEHFLTVPLATRSADLFRIMAAENGTSVSIDGTVVATLDRGEYYETTLSAAVEITSTAPISVMQFSQSSEVDGAVGDPFMMLVTPTEQYIPAYTVVSIDHTGYTGHYLNLVAPTSALAGVLLDSVAVSSMAWTAIGSSGYSAAQLVVDAGAHTIASDAPLAVSAYGFGPFDSYGYAGGFALAPVAEVANLSLSPTTAFVAVGDGHLVVATVTDSSGNPLENVRVDFTVSGTQSLTASVFTDQFGHAAYEFIGVTNGIDSITATVGDESTTAEVNWAATAPSIAIQSPAGGDSFTAGAEVLITGVATSASANGRIVQVSVNGRPVDSVDAAGRFFATVDISLGSNSWTFEALDSTGAMATTSIQLTGVESPLIAATQHTDISAAASLIYRGTTFNRQTHTLLVTAAVRNDGVSTLSGPVIAAVDRITPSNVTLASAEGTLADDRGYVVFDTELPGSELAGGATSAAIQLAFANAADERFTPYISLLIAANAAPRFTSSPATMAAADRPYVYQLIATDAEQSDLAYRIENGPAGMSIDANTGLVAWTPSTAAVGTHTIRLVADDGFGGTATQEFTITVELAPANRPPLFVSAPMTVATPGVAYEYDASAVDPDGDTVTYALDAGPAGMSIDTNTGVVTWTNPLAGDYAVTIRALDGNGSEAVQSFTLAVGEPQSNPGAPQILSTPSVTAVVGDLYAYLPAAVDPEGDPLSFTLVQSPTGMTIDAITGQILWTPTAGQIGQELVQLRVDDGLGGFATQLFSISVTATSANRAPVITSTPLLVATIETAYSFQLAATDPDLDPIEFELVSGPAGMTVTIAGLVSWNPAAADQGSHHVVLRAFDTAGASAFQEFFLTVRDANTAPVFDSTPTLEIVAGTVYRYVAHATDSEDAITYALVAGPAGMTIDARLGTLRWTSPTGTIDDYAVTVRATDERGLSTDQTFTLSTIPDTTAATATIITADRTAMGESVFVQVLATDNVGIASVTLTLDGNVVTLGSGNTATFEFATAGVHELVATVIDDSGLVTTTSRRFSIYDPADTTAPTVALNLPAEGTVVTYLTDILGMATDDNLEFFRLEYALVGTNQFYTFAEVYGTSVVNDLLGVFDPTLLTNDDYVIRLTAQDTNQNTATTEVIIGLDGRAKLGEFALSFTDLSIPVAGIPITITRNYSTLDRNEQGDFGFGWSLGARDARIRETVPTTAAETDLGVLFAEGFKAGTRIYLTNADGRRVGFTFTPEAEGGLLGTLWHAKFTADPGVFDTLTVDDVPLRQLADGTFALYFGGIAYNPNEYTLTSKDNISYRYSQFEGLQTITDRNGNVLTFTDAGITASSGQSVEFIRDALGRITQIIDPAGNALIYTYDERGDLIEHQTQAGLTSTYEYSDDPAHYLIENREGCGCFPSLRIEYDDAGRVIAQRDALGNAVAMDYNLAANQESIVDRMGQPTVITFDDRGNILSQVDPVGDTISATFDAADNLLTQTDGNGNTTTLSYDSRGNVLEMVDALGGHTQYVYSAANDLISVTDALGRTTTTVRDSRGNVLEIIDAAGESSTMAYDGRGRLTSVTDFVGRRTEMNYGDSSNPIRIIHTDGNEVLLSYDELGALVSQTNENGATTSFQRDTQGRLLAIVDAAGRSTTFWYDNNLLVAVTDREGNSRYLEYDATQQLVREIDAAGGITTYERDANDRRTRVIKANGAITEYIRRADGQVTSLLVDGTTTEYQYDGNKNITAIVDGNGHSMSWNYDALNRITDITNGIGATQSWTFDAVGNVLVYEDPLGYETHYTYSAVDLLIESLDALGQSDHYAYNANRDLVSHTDRNGNATSYSYDARQRLVETVDALGGVMSRTYDAAGNVLSQTDPLGRTTSFVYDDLNRRVLATDPLGETTATAYNAEGFVTSITDALGRTTSFTYDELYRTTVVTNALGFMTSSTFDAVGNRTGMTDQLGRVTAYSFNERNQMVSMTDALGNTYTYVRDAVGNVVATEDPLGRVTASTFDEANRLISSTDAAGGVTEFQFDLAGNLLSITDANGHTTTRAYDALQRMTSVTDATGFTQSFSFDNVGNLLTQTDALGHVTTHAYDDLNRRVSTTGPNSAVQSWIYDSAGQLLASVDSLGRMTGYEYSDRGEMIRQIDAAGGITEYTFDAVGNVTAFEDPSGNITQYLYDDLDRKITEIDPLGHAFQFSFDGAGNLVQKTDRLGRVTTFEFDELNRLVEETWLDGSTVINQIEMTYDAVGNVLSALDYFSAYTFTYDDLNRTLSVDNAGTPGVPHIVLTSSYDAVGNRTVVADNHDVAVNSTYDARNQLIERAWEGGGIDPARIDFSYDARGDLSSVARYAGLFATNLVGTSSYLRDDVGRPTEITHRNVFEDVLAEFEYEFDLASQLIEWSHHGQTIQLSQDSLGQITEADYSGQVDESYQYDQNGNRVGSGNVVGANNRLLSDGVYVYSYNNEGSLVSKTNIATGEIAEYSYDHRNRLTAVVIKSAGGLILHEVRYVYDVFDRKIATTTDGQTIYHVYDGQHVWADFDGSGNLSTRYMYGDRLDQILARWRASESTVWHLTDHVGTVHDLMHSTGAVVNHLDYSSFGRILSQSSLAWSDRFTFTAREWDAVSELYQYRSRWYDPMTGRFLSEDGWRFGGGDANLSRYVANNPLTATDPTGHAELIERVYVGTVTGGVAGALLWLGCGGIHWAYGAEYHEDFGTYVASGVLVGAAVGLASFFLAPAVLIATTAALAGFSAKGRLETAIQILEERQDANAIVSAKAQVGCAAAEVVFVWVASAAPIAEGPPARPPVRGGRPTRPGRPGVSERPNACSATNSPGGWAKLSAADRAIVDQILARHPEIKALPEGQHVEVSRNFSESELLLLAEHFEQEVFVLNFKSGRSILWHGQEVESFSGIYNFASGPAEGDIPALLSQFGPVSEAKHVHPTIDCDSTIGSSFVPSHMDMVIAKKLDAPGYIIGRRPDGSIDSSRFFSP